MDKKEKELLSMHYQIEKTDIKQQKLEDRILSISEELRKSKNIRNFYFAFIVILIAVTTLGGFYLSKNDMAFGSDGYAKSNDEIKHLIYINDSLQNEIKVLKSDILEYQKKVHSDTVAGISRSNIVYESPENEKNISLTEEDTLPEESKLKYERRYCYVKRVFESNETVFAEVDFIEFYKGRRAVQEAKKMGEAEYDIDKKGDTLYFLYNNYYISNQNSKTIILELDNKARVRVDNINQISGGFPLKAFQKIISDKPILILEINNGIIYKITQQKLP